jgi:hypothetical protein
MENKKLGERRIERDRPCKHAKKIRTVALYNNKNLKEKKEKKKGKA